MAEGEVTCVGSPQVQSGVQDFLSGCLLTVVFILTQSREDLFVACPKTFPMTKSFFQTPKYKAHNVSVAGKLMEL